MVFIHPNPD